MLQYWKIIFVYVECVRTGVNANSQNVIWYYSYVNSMENMMK